MYIAKLKNETIAKGKTWPAGHPITRDGKIVVWREPCVSDWEFTPVEAMNPRFELKEVKKK